MSDTTGSRARMLNGLFWAALGAVVIYMIVRHIGVFGNVVIVLLGFGTVVLVHEFGHFIVAKLSGIRVEAFSIFMPPTLLGIRKTAAGWRFRFLPSLASEKDDEPAEPLEATEYRIGIFPFGGYVKLLGQEDTGPVKQVDDQRSFARKSVGTRIAVISAGVIFNVISAALIFIAVFLVGIRLPPPIVGGVIPGSSAAQAGLRPGDVVTEIKTSARAYDQGTLARHFQLTAYRYAYARLYKRDAKLKVTAFLKQKKPRVEEYEARRSPDDDAWFVHVAAEANRGICSGIFPPSPSFLCGDCEYAENCRKWRGPANARCRPDVRDRLQLTLPAAA